MKINKEYFIVFTLLLIIITIVFSELISGVKVLASSDTLSPIAIKNGINLSYSKYSSYPLWIPWIFSGLPTIHSLLNVSYSYYPHRIITFFINMIQLPWIWNFIFHFIFGGLGMYKFLKYLRISKHSSFIVSFSFMIMPYMIVMTVHGHGSQMMTACFLPWIMFLLFKLVNKLSLINFSFLALFVGLQLQRGHIQIAYYTWMMIGLYLLVNIINNLIYQDKNYVKIVKKYFFIFLSLLTGIAISLNLYFPVLNYSTFSTRGSEDGGIGLLNATQWSFSLPEIITLIIPSFFGFGGRLYWGGMPFTDYPNYVGILLFIFAIYGLLKSKINSINKVYFILVIIFSGFLSLGKNFMIFYSLFYHYLPFFDKFRSPVFILLIFNFSLYILSAYGIDSFVKKYKENVHSKLYYYLTASMITILGIVYFTYNYFIPDKIKNSTSLLQILENLITSDIIFLFSILTILLIFIYVLYRYNLNYKYLYYVVALFCFFDFLRIDKEIINPKSHIPNKTVLKDKDYIDKFLSKDETVQFLLTDESNYRIFDLIGEQNRWSVFNIENVRGYHSAKLSIYNNLINEIEALGYNIWPSGILKLLNVKYIILPESNFEHPTFKKITSKSMYYFGYSDKHDGNLIKVNIFENKDFLPRLFYTRKLENFNSDQIHNKILSESFHPELTSYIDNDDLNLSYSFLDNNPIIQIKQITPNNIYFSTNTNSEQFLVFSEIFFPFGWILSDGEKEYPIYKVNDLVRGAFIPSGKNNFIMTFYPNDLFISKFLSIIITLSLLIIISATYIKRKKDA